VCIDEACTPFGFDATGVQRTPVWYVMSLPASTASQCVVLGVLWSSGCKQPLLLATASVVIVPCLLVLWFLSVLGVAASATHQCLPVVLLECLLSGRTYCSSLKGNMVRIIYP
jgi:hypothetical protein